MSFRMPVFSSHLADALFILQRLERVGRERRGGEVRYPASPSIFKLEAHHVREEILRL
jgi:hypothetical protein